MDHPKPRNYPKGKSGPKKRIASLTPLETTDVKKTKVMEDPMVDPAVDLLTHSLSIPNDPSTNMARMENGEPSPLGSLGVKYELEPRFDTDTDTDPSIDPSTETSVDPGTEPEAEQEFEPECDTESESEFEPDLESGDRGIENQKLFSIKLEPETFDEL